MTAQPDRPLLIRIAFQKAMQPELLQGLEVWLQLGLISEEQVRLIGQDYLSCTLPSREASSGRVATARSSGELMSVGQGDDRADFLPPPPSPSRSKQAVAIRHPPSLVGRTLQAFMAEISVIWLLFLGVFLVVVSSGVLAASQWHFIRLYPCFLWCRHLGRPPAQSAPHCSNAANHHIANYPRQFLDDGWVWLGA